MLITTQPHAPLAALEFGGCIGDGSSEHAGGSEKTRHATVPKIAPVMYLSS
ncbi:hypothetical protein I5Q34_26760 [Streptomyces sp. AV19]|uniref:hypothetical protein n=1 Tax=Streptomyces sp. AV19 TaxID=2793068 RepID=UPI0018FEF212|nr:hypothetical protein [Streptomyces sp. AV19]MBH1937829.1 hypothetical protein [Streptomyces sp. AV19]MDG4537107.1 hypothetical protein [Streptomyces sp. AV19]